MKGLLYLGGDWIGSLVWVYDLVTCLFSFLEHLVLLSRLVDSFVGGALPSIRTVAVSFDGIGGRILSPGISAIQLILLVGQMRTS